MTFVNSAVLVAKRSPNDERMKIHSPKTSRSTEKKGTAVCRSLCDIWLSVEMLMRDREEEGK